MSGPAMTTVQTALEQLVEQNDGLRSIVITDRDGAVVLRASDERQDQGPSDQIFTTIFAASDDQTEKIPQLGAANFILTTYNNCICLQANDHPCIIKLLGEADCNAGALIDLLPHIKAMLGSTREVVMRETENDWS
eukprot:TRINITY_DN72851_c0_g1_i1.p1 TRINITY_DN72851_c0_g1~~TRINITY_DN72851_c0_g1_i1.p1  ORF type:complete len:136 (-),score=27.39 TRINITY_DN72851_c0_g1_i1:207-614(-)